ncbi:hypothetical protein I4U23_026123 [Adineta vaga]|nr:hypothetical protein I4U23_026123 [Adineta vaga]
MYYKFEQNEELNRDEFIALKHPKQKDERDRRHGRFKYIFGDGTVQVSETITGCKKEKLHVPKIKNTIYVG